MNNQKKTIKTDIVIVGGGHSGLTQTLLLAQNGLKVVCVDQQDPKTLLDPTKDGRTTAISFGSHQLMKAAHIWEDLLPYTCPINDIQILDGTSPILLDFHAEDMAAETGDNTPAFGWIIENYRIHEVLHKTITKQKNATHLTKTIVKDYDVQPDKAYVILENNQIIEANLIIGADGRQSFTREYMNVGAKEWSYDQQAIVCVITHEKPHHNIAVEHFKAAGPLAVLPMLNDKDGNHRSAVVWTQHSQNANQVLNYNQETYLIALNNIIPEFYGEITDAGKRFSYPLNFVHAYDYIKPRIALIADAAHGIHPIAGQGLNLGLRDVAALTDILIAAQKSKQDIGAIKILEKYQKQRRPDNMAMAMTTDILNKVFSNNILPIKTARKIGLKIINKFYPAKKFFMRQAMGSSGHLPKIIRNGKV